MLAAFIGAAAQVKPENGRNPLVVRAQGIRITMPGDELETYDYEDDGEEDEPLPEPRSEDEQLAGVNVAPPGEAAPRRRRRRRPPMPRVPVPADGPEPWTPPFEVLSDGTVTGPKLGDADPTRLPEGFDPPRGSFEGVTSIFRPPGAGGNALPSQ